MLCVHFTILVFVVDFSIAMEIFNTLDQCVHLYSKPNNVTWWWCHWCVIGGEESSLMCYCFFSGTQWDGYSPESGHGNEGELQE